MRAETPVTRISRPTMLAKWAPLAVRSSNRPAPTVPSPAIPSVRGSMGAMVIDWRISGDAGSRCCEGSAGLGEELLDRARGLADALLVLDERDADEAFAVLAKAERPAKPRRQPSRSEAWRTRPNRDDESAQAPAPRRTSWRAAMGWESPPRPKLSTSASRRLLYMARISSTHSCGPFSAAAAATWIGVKAP